MESIYTLQAREEEVGREWEWLHDVINRVARAKAHEEGRPRFPHLAGTGAHRGSASGCAAADDGEAAKKGRDEVTPLSCWSRIGA